jgi:tetratricopeptide (TPR) repeat protein
MRVRAAGWFVMTTVSGLVLLASPASGEYKELTELRQSSENMLKEYARQLAAEDAKFEGIVQFGRALGSMGDPAKLDLAKLTYQSKDYWRATLEATPQDSSILFAHAHLHAARGEPAWADIYFLVGSLTAAKDHRGELDAYKQLRNRLTATAGRQIDGGIKLHDAGQYMKAIETYDRVLAEHPGCALAYYEKGLSYMMMSKTDPALKQKALDMYARCRQLDPFHWKAYQGSDPNVIRKLQVYLEKVHPFVSGKQRDKAGFLTFVEGCEAMELWPVAAHAQWKLALMDSDNFRQHLRRFLDLIEKCGCQDADFFRRQFKLDQP